MNHTYKRGMARYYLQNTNKLPSVHNTTVKVTRNNKPTHELISQAVTMATIQWTFKRSMTALLLLLLFGGSPNPGHATSGDQLVELLPSDVPITMMDRLNTAKASQAKDPVELVTSLGIITGLREPTLPPYYDNTHMQAFRGIPFAKAPVGDLRFADPVDMVGKWSGGRLDATKFRSFCPQYDVESKTIFGAEDCLFLNVYTPLSSDEESIPEKKLLPVFVFIHGGAFIRGSSSAHGAEKLLSRDVVVVTINYRLGALGYLSTGDSVLPGNYGMMDQVSALRWVQRNIAQFGGNPDQVTLGGFSAGSSSVHMHMMSPLSENLFHRGIMMSGSAPCYWGMRKDPLTPARLLAEKLGCPIQTSQAISTCLASKTVNQIITAQAAIYKYEFFPVWFIPVIDGGIRSKPFLPAPLHELTLRPTPTIVGSVPNEGLLFAANVILLSNQPSNATSIYEEAVRYLFSPWPYPETDEAMKDLAESFYYSKHAKTSPGALIEQMSEALTDFAFLSCIWDAASSIAKSGAPVYPYLMTHRDPETPTWAEPMYQRLRKLGYNTPLLQTGISHGDDLVHLFSFPYSIGKGTARDHRVTQMILNMFTNFITNGLPQENLDRYSLGDIAKWEKVEPDQPVGFYSMTVNPSMVHTPFKLKERNFWRSVVPYPDSSATSKTPTILQEVIKPTDGKASLSDDPSLMSHRGSSSYSGSCPQ